MAQRTTLTLQDDVYEAVRLEAERTGLGIKDVVNDAIRRGLAAPPTDDPVELEIFSSRMLIDPTSTSATLELLEGSTHR